MIAFNTQQNDNVFEIKLTTDEYKKYEQAVSAWLKAIEGSKYKASYYGTARDEYGRAYDFFTCQKCKTVFKVIDELPKYCPECGVEFI